jgi:hypothetical protein
MYTTVQVRSEFGKFAYTAICMRNVRYDYVTLIPLVLQLGLRIGPIQRIKIKIKILVKWIFQLYFCISGHNLLFPTIFK